MQISFNFVLFKNQMKFLNNILRLPFFITYYLNRVAKDLYAKNLKTIIV